MNGIEISVKPTETGDMAEHPMTEYIFLLAGIFGLQAFLYSIDGVTFSPWIVYSMTAIVCWGVWYLSCYRRKAFFLLAFASIVVCGIMVFLMGDLFRGQIGYMINCVTEGSAAETIPVTETALLMSILLIFFIVLSEILLKSHEVLYVLTMLLVLVSPILGVRVGMGVILLLVLFQTTFQVIQADFPLGVKEKWDGIKRHQLSGRSSTAVGVILAGLFLVIVPVLLICREGAYNCVYSVEGQVRRALLRSFGRAGEPVTGGRVHNGNNYPTGTVHLELEASDKPKEMLYLRGFSGGDYVGGSWRSADDETLLMDIMLQQNWQDLARVMETRYDGMYYVMNENMRTEEPPHSISLTLKHYGGAYDNLYVPYYSQRFRRYYREEGDDMWYDYGYGNTREGYIYRYYEQSDMKIDWDNVSTNFWLERDWFMEMQEAYMREIQSVYTKVPTEILPKLTGLCGEKPMENLDEITAFILHTLNRNAVYSLTPGWAPLNEDIVEYFLFEGGRGYCEHFAAAATLMYRLYGVPARYATGYLISPDDFTEQENGVWAVSVTDEAAHAWTEIFLADYGWTPVEVTPAGDGGSRAAYPGFNQEVFRQIQRRHGWEEEEAGALEENGTKKHDGKYSWWEADGRFDFEIDIEENKQWFYALGACILYSLCMLPFFLDYRRLKRLKKLEKSGCRRVFSRLLLMLRFEGILEGYDGTEEDFAEQLGQALSVSSEDIARMQAIVSQAAFGIKAPEREEEDYVRSVYMRLAEAVYGTLQWHRKLMFRYWKAFY